MKYRKHQSSLQQLLSEMQEADLPCRIVTHVVPGGGKSILPALAAEAFPNYKIGWFVPRLSLATQAAESLQQHFNIEIFASGNTLNPSRGKRGFVTTHQALSADPELWRHELKRFPYILVFDELHHAKVGRDGQYQSVASALSRLPYRLRLDMTGTLDTSDNSFIEGIDYETRKDGMFPCLESKSYRSIRYTRQDALNDSAIVPIQFHYHDGPVAFSNNGQETQVDLSGASSEDAAAALYTALRTEFAEKLFLSGVDHWRRRKSGKLIVVTASQDQARKYHKKLAEMNVPASLAIADNADAHKEVKCFRGTNGIEMNALVTCQMAYEGLDAPAASHLICLTHIRSTPWIEQMFGRIWRAHKGKDKCFAFVPNDPRMNRVIESIKAENPGCVSLPKEGPCGPGGQFDVVALRGDVTDVELGMLDGHIHNTEAIAAEVNEVLERHGLMLGDPFTKEVLLNYNGSETTKRVITVAERMGDKSKKLSDECRNKASRMGFEFGYYEKRLWTIHGNRGFDQLTEEELDNACKLLSHL